MKDNFPSHIAIIMDGNRRWAKAHGLSPSSGHREGARNLERLVEAAAQMGVKTLTVYALSTENLQERAKREISALFGLIEKSFQEKIAQMTKNGVKVDVLGEMDDLPHRLQEIIKKTREVYIQNEAIKVNIALNYGGRRELVNAIQRLIEDGINLDQVNEQAISQRLYSAGQSDPELVIRTGGKVRLSNFLLWQTAYSELYFSKKLWPDFTKKDLKAAISWYQKQKRNFGK